ncbi:CDP-glycerol glycerophosphotransferase family protein [Mammaliicoccus lentus]|nr:MULTISPECIES: CDP-glycerol glycerophosphotransferase family protein [Mammaliicoccus]WQL55546.1 CDP-glycerol glycerophosphotransferase family protein [Mammaliicoccus lentus]SCU43523.1 CDP-glycerol:poly(glycerophosphate) glycerophosphotransferase [Mammaliicoccus lentus]
MKLRVINNEFILSDVEYKNIYVYHKNNKLNFKKENDKFILSYNDLQEFLTDPNEQLLLYNENDKIINIDIDQEEVNFGKNSLLKNGKNRYYIYINSRNNLSLIYNKKPSLNHLYNRDAEYKGTKVIGEEIHLYFEFVSKYFLPTSMSSTIVIRKTKKQINIPVDNFDCFKESNNRYRIYATIILDVQNITKLLGEDADILNYDFNVYDVFFNYKINEFPLTNLTPKIKFFEKDKLYYNDENWITFDNDNQMLVRFYRTFHGYLSFKITILPKDTYLYYINEIKKKNIKNNKTTIVCIEYPSSAQDNGLVFFEYLMKNYSKKYNIYYIINQNSSDLKNLEKYKDNVVYYKSPDNLKVLYEADVICHTHTSYYTLPFRANELERELSTKKRVFLQHGIIGVRNLRGMYARKPHERFTDLFVVSSEREKKIIVNGYGFSNDEAILTGLPRFDMLIKEKRNIIKKLKKKKSILLMPTWRPAQDVLSDDDFMKTDFYKTFNNLINNSDFKKMVNSNNYIVNLFLHRNFQKYNHLFKSNIVNTLSNEEHDIKDLLYNSNVLVTDYSSVGLDFAIMGKKVLYYQPPQIMEKQLKSINNIELPGKVVKNDHELINELKNIKADSDLDLAHLYKFKDKKACDRIMKHMIKQFGI